MKKLNSEKKNIAFWVDPTYELLIKKGKLHEMHDTKSDFVEHILSSYFKDKAYAKDVLKDKVA